MAGLLLVSKAVVLFTFSNVGFIVSAFKATDKAYSLLVTTKILLCTISILGLTFNARGQR